MRKSTIMILFLAGGFGLLAMFVIDRALKGDQPKIEEVSVVAASTNLLNFDVVTPEAIEPKKIRRSEYREGIHFRWPDRDLDEKEYQAALEELHKKVCDRTVVYSMMLGDLLIDEKLAPVGAGKGLAALIPPGMRAVSIDLPKASAAVAGFIKPRNRVDILAGFRDSETRVDRSETVVQNVEILAVDQRTRMESRDGMEADPTLKSATVLLTPEQAERVVLFARSSSALMLALRKTGDDSDENGGGETERPAIERRVFTIEHGSVTTVSETIQKLLEKTGQSRQGELIVHEQSRKMIALATAEVLDVIAATVEELDVPAPEVLVPQSVQASPLPSPPRRLPSIRTLRNRYWGKVSMTESGELIPVVAVPPGPAGDL